MNYFYLLGLYFLLLRNINKLQAVNTGNSSTDPFLEFDDDYDQDYSHVGSLKFHLIEEKVPTLISEVCLHNMRCPVRDCELSLIDIVEATQLSRFNTSTLVNAIFKLNISENDAYNIILIYDLTPQLFEYFLQTFGFTFSDIYKNFVSTLDNPSVTIPEILVKLNVSVLDFMNAQAYGNDSLRLQVLSYGNYSKQNIQDVLKIANKTSLDMLNLIPLDAAAKQIRKLNGLEFTNFIKNLGVTSENLEDFYKYLWITPINFISYPRFIQLITELYDLLNPQEVLATLISPNVIVTSNMAKALSIFSSKNDVLVSKYSSFKFELVENPLVQYEIDKAHPNNPEYQSKDIAFVSIKQSITTAAVEIANNYNFTTINNCTYVSKFPFGGLYVENVTKAQIDKDKIATNKTANTAYNLGSPLFCNGKLYGFAVEDGAGFIKFSTFMRKSSPGTTNPIIPLPPVISPPVISPPLGNGTHPNITSKPSKASVLVTFNVFIIVIGSVIIKLL